MSKSTVSKTNYALRREMRLRRDKAATALLAALLPSGGADTACIANAVRLADALIAELDKSRPDLVGEKQVGKREE